MGITVRGSQTVVVAGNDWASSTRRMAKSKIRYLPLPGTKERASTCTFVSDVVHEGFRLNYCHLTALVAS